MRITVKGKPYNLSFRHEAGPPSRLADLLARQAEYARIARLNGNTAVMAASDALAKAQQEAHLHDFEPLRKLLDTACLAVRRMPTPEQAIQRVLDKVDRSMRVPLPYDVFPKNSERPGLGRSARQPYLKRTLCTIWTPIIVEKDGKSETQRPRFDSIGQDQIIATGETKCSDLDVYIREEGRAIALARAVCSRATGFDRNALVSVGLQAFPVTARCGRQAYWRECAELRPDLWPAV